jgi:hypothetical protein
MKKNSPAMSLLCALGFVLLVGTFAFSLWAEWGPYAWVTAAQMAIMDSYFGKLNFVLTFVLFLIPAMILLFASRGRVAKTIALGVPGLLLLVHFIATIYFVSTGGTQAEATTFESAVRSASFIPQNITLERSNLPEPELEKTSGIRSGSSDAGAELYVPFTPSSWPSPDIRVVLKTKSENLTKLAAGETLTGVIHKAPLPYLVRHSWPQNPSLFAVIIEDRATVLGSWLGAAVVYAVLLIWGASNLFKSRHAKPAPQP